MSADDPSAGLAQDQGVLPLSSEWPALPRRWAVSLQNRAEATIEFQGASGSTHGEQQTARRAYLRIARFFAGLRAKAEQLDAVQRWYRILSEALRKYLRGRQLIPPARLQPA